MTQTHHSHHPQNKYSNSPHLSAPAKHNAHRGLKAKPSHDEVARKAYEIYQKENCPQGCAMQHWLQAEAQLSG